MTEQSPLHHLLDRARRGVILPAEGEALAVLVTELEAEVSRLTAGQCTHTRRMCDLHHAQPVTDCPYPKCIKAREQQPPVHLAKGTNAEDCPACHGTNPDYPFLCPGSPTTA